ncbi:MAG: hypothetical protein ACRYFR_02760 [Janthinobacterium lividum]
MKKVEGLNFMGNSGQVPLSGSQGYQVAEGEQHQEYGKQLNLGGRARAAVKNKNGYNNHNKATHWK